MSLLSVPAGPFRLVVLRHGESQWNALNRFTGWEDVGLSAKGEGEAHAAGASLKAQGFEFDVVVTSVLRRAINTANIVLSEMSCDWLPMVKDWRFNERHYGALQGLNKAETAALHGEEQVKLWRRSYSTRPPELAATDARHPCHDRRYENLPAGAVPATESLADCRARVLDSFDKDISSLVSGGKRVLIVAHGNSLRGLTMGLEKLTEEEVLDLNIPTGVPLVFELERGTLKFVKKYYIGDVEEIAKAIAGVASQASATFAASALLSSSASAASGAR